MTSPIAAPLPAGISDEWNDHMSATEFLEAPSRRNPLASRIGAAAGAGSPAQAGKLTSNTMTVNDGTVIYYKDWGSGPVVVFSHGYPLSSDFWEDQMLFLAQHGYRVIAHDRRGFGRSGQPSRGYDYDTFADDLAALVEALDLTDATFVGHSMGGGEVARYVGRHGEDRVAKVALVSAVPPLMLKTAANPAGMLIEAFDGMRAAVQANRAQFFADVSLPYFNYNRPGAEVSQGVRDSFWRQCMATGMLAAYSCIGAFSETDFTEALKKISVPTLIVHGSDDQIVPIEAAGKAAARIVKTAELLIYEGGSHGLPVTHKDRLNADLLAFLKS